MPYYQNLKKLREDKKITQKEMAEILGTSRSHYSKCEKGTRAITFSMMIKLAKFYDVSIDYIAGLTNDKRKKMVKNSANFSAVLRYVK